MTRPTHKLTDDRLAAMVALVRGELVDDGEAWAYRDSNRLGTFYVVRGPRPTDDDEGDPRAHATPERAIEDLLDRRAAPEPDELTVDDVLRLLQRAVREADDYHPVAWRVDGRLEQLRFEDGKWHLRDLFGKGIVSSGSLHNLLVSQKRRGLLG